MLVKVWLRDDCRRFTLSPGDFGLESIRLKIQELYQFPDPDGFVLKYKDAEGDLVTIGSSDDFEELLESDLLKDAQMFKLYVYPRAGSTTAPSQSVDDVAGGVRGMAIGNGADTPTAPTNAGSADSAAQDAKVDRFETTVTEREVLEILRDISLYITAVDLTPVNQWVSAKKSLITPAAASALPRAPQRYSRITRRDVHESRSGSGGALESRPVEDWTSWTVDDVCNWLQLNGFDEVLGMFKGEVLLALNNDELKDMGVSSTGKRIKLLTLIEELKTSLLASNTGQTSKRSLVGTGVGSGAIPGSKLSKKQMGREASEARGGMAAAADNEA
ncbi:hypothetical protein HK104_007879 [Borealophlyctis nickersoniae]|nr:hypothetical protein HK104_007879 [Borealophlyctis nickersoniae]